MPRRHVRPFTPLALSPAMMAAALHLRRDDLDALNIPVMTFGVRKRMLVIDAYHALRRKQHAEK